MIRPLRVLSISTLFPNAARAGFGLFVARQAQAVSRRGDVELVVANPLPRAPLFLDRFIHSPGERAVPAAARDWGVDVHYPRFLHIPSIGWRWNPALVARSVLPLARRLHAEMPFDLVDAQFFYPDGPAAMRVAAALGLPFTIKARGSDIHLWGARPAALREMHEAARQAAGMLAVSDALRRDMAAIGMPGERIAVHYTGLDHALFRPKPREEARRALPEGYPRHGPLLVTVGNLIPLKGNHLVIEALAQVPGAMLVLAGKGPQAEALRQMAGRLGLADRVLMPGGLAPADLANLLAAADAMVLPSEREGLANAWIEALACGTPLVITDVGGAREVVVDDSAGRLVARDAASIAGAVNALLASPPSQDKVAAHAARFSWEANAAQLASFWQAAADQPSGSR